MPGGRTGLVATSVVVLLEGAHGQQDERGGHHRQTDEPDPRDMHVVGLPLRRQVGGRVAVRVDRQEQRVERDPGGDDGQDRTVHTMRM